MQWLALGQPALCSVWERVSCFLVKFISRVVSSNVCSYCHNSQNRACIQRKFVPNYQIVPIMETKICLQNIGEWNHGNVFFKSFQLPKRSNWKEFQLYRGTTVCLVCCFVIFFYVWVSVWCEVAFSFVKFYNSSCGFLNWKLGRFLDAWYIWIAYLIKIFLPIMILICERFLVSVCENANRK